MAATVKTKADSSGLHAEVDKAAKAASVGAKATVGVELDSSRLAPTVKAAAAKAKTDVQMKLDADTREFNADMVKARVGVDRLHQKMGFLKLKVDDKSQATFTRLQNNIRTTELKLRKLDGRKITPELQLQAAKYLADIAKYERAANKIDGRTLEQNIKLNVNKDKHKFLAGMSEMLGSATRMVGESANNMSGILREPKVLIGVIGALLLALPSAATLAAGGIVFAFGGGLAALGMVAAAKTQRVSDAFDDMKKKIISSMRKVAQPMGDVMIHIFDTINRVWPKIASTLGKAFKIMAPGLKVFGDALVKAFAGKDMSKAIVDIAKAFSALAIALAPMMTTFFKDFAKSLSHLSEVIGDNPQAFTHLLGGILKLVTGILNLVAVLAKLSSWVDKHIPSLWKAMFGGIGLVFSGGWLKTPLDKLQGIIGGAFKALGNVVAGSVRWIQRTIGGIPAMFSKMGGLVRSIWGGLWKWVSGRAQDAMNFVGGVARNFWHDVAGFFMNLAGGVRRVWAGLWGWVSNRAQDVMNFIGSRARNFWHDVVDFFKSLATGVRRVWAALWGWVSGRAQDAMNFIGRMAGNFWHNIVDFFKSLANGVRRIWAALWGWVSDRAHDAVNFIGNFVQKFWHNIVDWFGRLWHGVVRVWNNLWDGLKRVVQGMVDKIGGIIGTIRDLFAKPFNWVVEHVWHPFAHVWNMATHAVGLDLHIPDHFQEGGRVGGHGNGDIVPALLEPGERVLSRKQVGAMGGHSAIDTFFGGVQQGDNTHFQRGGKVRDMNKGGDTGMRPGGTDAIRNRGQSASGSGGIGGIAASVWNGIKSTAGGLMDILMKPVGFIMRKVFLPIIDGVIPGSFTGGKKFLHAALRRLAEFGSKQAHAAAGAGSGNAIIKFASKYIGKVPYRWGGNTPSGWDCSGFTRWVYKHCGVGGGMPRVAQDQMDWTKRTSGPIPGGLAFFGSRGNIHHVGIVKNQNAMINAAHSGTLTRIDSMRNRDLFGFGIPPHGFRQAIGPGTPGHGLVPANAQAIGRFLMGNGLSRAAAAGILGNIMQESGGNPRIFSRAGGGLFGETIANGGRAGGGSLAQQLGRLMHYINANGSVGDINRHAKNAAQAALWFSSHYERPGIPNNARRVASARASFRAFGNGGRITEPIVGFGMRSGGGYLFGEKGNETVVPDGGGDYGYGIESRLDQLISLMAAAPGATGAAVAGGFNGMSRSAGYKSMYPNSGGGSR